MSALGELNIGMLFYINLLIHGFLYYFIFKRRKLIGFQLGMNITIIAGGMMAISTGILLISQFPYHYTIVTIISTLVGMAVGSLFGAMFDYQTVLTGYANGLMMGIMAPMIGAVVDSTGLFILFIEVVLIVSTILVISSAKSS